MKRRSFIQGAAAAGVAGAAVAASNLPKPAISQGRKELRMVTSWPKGFPGLGTAADRVAKRIEALSDGRYTVKVYGGGELVHALKCHDALQEGTADLYHSADYYYQGKLKGLAYFTAVPFGFTPNEIDAWIHHGGGQALWDEAHAQFGVKAFVCSNTGSQMGGWFKNPMESLEDFKGLKMRIPGLAGGVIEALGGTSVTLSGAEVMPALQSGAIDATEWVGPWNDLAFGFYKVVKHYHYPGFHEPGSTLSMGIRKELYDGMSDLDKAIIEHAAVAENNYGLAEFNANNTQALDTLINEHGVQLHQFPDEVYKAMGEAAKDVLADTAKADATTKKIYDSFMAFRTKAVRWTKLSDQTYANKRELVSFS